MYYKYIKYKCTNKIMNNYDIDFTTLTATELKNIGNKFNLPISTIRKKSDLIHIISSRYYQLSKYMKYSYIKQLGFEGLDGRTFLVRDDDGHEYAIKIYKDTKEPRQIEKEVELQIKAGGCGVAPRVIEYSSMGKFIVMEKLTITLYHLFRKQNNSLSSKQQKAIIKLFRELDKCRVFHGDPNPLNFMRRNGTWYAIDYGFATEIDSKCIARYGPTPNLSYMPTGLYLKFKEIYPNIKLEYIEKHIDKTFIK